MNKSFESRFFNLKPTPVINSKQEAMRKMREGVKLPGWGGKKQSRQGTSSVYFNQQVGSPEYLLAKVEEEIKRQEEGVRDKKFFYIPSPIEDWIRQLDDLARKNALDSSQEIKLGSLKRAVEELKKNSERNKLP